MREAPLERNWKIRWIPTHERKKTYKNLKKVHLTKDAQKRTKET